MNIIITGASRGIGFETALRISETGKHNLLLVSRDMEKLEKLKGKIISSGSQSDCYLFEADLSSENELAALCRSIEVQFPVIDILINNAGALVNKPFSKCNSSDINSMLMLNFLAPAKLITELLPLLLKSPRAHVVNIGSMGGLQGSVKFPGLSYYSASKGALAVLTECLAAEYSNTGLRFNCLALGSADTEMMREAFPGYSPPLSAAEMAGFIADFALNGHTFFNGKVLPVALTSP